ncbi:hypothetical protein LTR08_005885 [Meristemomyces frigidus]|nr:hypothetical protein LTR08_005885 [Meristemomyces frigidus]
MSLRTITRALPSRLTMRTFSVATRLSAGGDAGAPRSGGSAQGDAFTKREQASENYEIQRREKDKLQALKAKHEKLKLEAEAAGKELEKAEKEGKQ